MSGQSAYDPGRVGKAALALVRMAFGGPSETGSLENMSEADWKGVYVFAARQGILPIVYDGTAELPKDMYPPRNLLLQWGVNASMSEERYARQQTVLEKLVTFYSANSVDTLLLKGFGLSFYYPVPQHRECGDIDIYLFGEFEKGNRLAEEAGCRVKPAESKHSSFVFEGITIENHRMIVDEDRNRRIASIEAVLENMISRGNLSKISIGKANLWTPSADFNAVYLIAHAASHFSGGEMLSVRNLCDWARFLAAERENIDSAFLNKILKESRLHTLCALMTGFCERHLGLGPQGFPEPDREIEAKFDELIFRFRTLAPPDETLVQRTRRIWQNRWRYQDVLNTGFLQEIFYRYQKGRGKTK